MHGSQYLEEASLVNAFFASFHAEAQRTESYSDLIKFSKTNYPRGKGQLESFWGVRDPAEMHDYVMQLAKHCKANPTAKTSEIVKAAFKMHPDSVKGAVRQVVYQGSQYTARPDDISIEELAEQVEE